MTLRFQTPSSAFQSPLVTLWRYLKKRSQLYLDAVCFR